MKTMDKPKLERDVKKSVKDVFVARDAYQFWPVQTGLGASTLDCLACVPLVITPEMVGKTIGAFVAIETKRPEKDQVTPRQAHTIKAIRKAGGVALMVNQIDYDAVADKLKWALRTGYVQAALAQEG
jgi:hypothetical protein